MNTRIKCIKPGYVILTLSTALVLTGCADLVVTDVHYAPFLGHTLQVKATVKNEGSVDAQTSTTRLEIKPAGSTTFTRTSTGTTPPLAAGQEHESIVGLLQPSEVPATGSGQCIELRACADSDNVVQEGPNEGNNCKTNITCR